MRHRSGTKQQTTEELQFSDTHINKHSSPVSDELTTVDRHDMLVCLRPHQHTAVWEASMTLLLSRSDGNVHPSVSTQPCAPVWKSHWLERVFFWGGGVGEGFFEAHREPPPGLGGVRDRPSLRELTAMMNGHLSILYCPTKSYAFHAFITNFCCFLIPSFFGIKLQRASTGLSLMQNILVSWGRLCCMGLVLF